MASEVADTVERAGKVNGTAEQEEFNKLDKSVKLDRLNKLIQRSQVYSNIIAENILQTGLNKKQVQVEGSRRKKRKTNGSGGSSGGSANGKNKDIVSMLSAPSANDSSRKQPKMMSGGKLKDYQLDGMDWLITLFENGLNGILADEMGLGKTIQCIAFLLFLIENGIKGPFLIVAPLSTVSNWQQEIKNFAPSINTSKYIGSKPDRANMKLTGKDVNIVVTSYETSLKDFTKLNKVDWKFLIIDEGHRLKNMNCELIKALKRLNVANKLLITGTPLQNNLKELWSLLNFILPDIFHDLDLFEQWFNFDELTNFGDENADDDETNQLIQLNIQESLVKNLHTILKPFLLRRVKKEVVQNLPPKKEYIIHVSLSPLQRRLYQAALKNNLLRELLETYLKEYIYCNHRDEYDQLKIESFIENHFLSAPLEKRSQPTTFKEAESGDEFEETLDDDAYNDETNGVTSGISPEADEQMHLYATSLTKILKELKGRSLLNLVIQLRNICNSPYIYYDPIDSDRLDQGKFFELLVDNSSKFKVLEQLLDKLLLSQHKVLIFSQFTTVLDLLSDWLDYEGVESCRIDGSVNQVERDTEINEFNHKKTSKQVFLLSTRAGGLGINLTAADTVIIFDNDWNPQIDLQAIDRVHRIGQTKPVKVFRFLVRNSIEEILISKSYSKRFLEKIIIQMGEYKFKKFKSVISNKNVNMNNIMSLSKQFKINGTLKEESADELPYSITEEKNGNVLSNSEIDELMDRSIESYRKSKEFDNISLFETMNNMDL